MKQFLRNPAEKIPLKFLPFYPNNRVLKFTIGAKISASLTDSGNLYAITTKNLDEMNINTPKVIAGVRRFEVNGYLIYEDLNGELWIASLGKDCSIS